MPKVYIGGNTIETEKEMRPRDEFDFYPTEAACIEAYFASTQRERPTHVLDPAAGTGVWGRVLRTLYPDISYLAGVELQDIVTDDARFMYDSWLPSTNYLTLDDTWLHPERGNAVKFDLIATNPPYKCAEEFFWKAMEHLDPNGSIVFLLRLGFLASERRYKSMWSAGYAPTTVTVLNTRPSFTGDGKTYPGDFAMFQWDFTEGAVKNPTETRFLVYTR